MEESGEEWRDITSLISSVSEDMAEEEMLTAKSFSLFEAMSALELMEPRMDPPPELIVTVETLLSMGVLVPGAELSERAVARASWKLMEKEHAWQSGASMADSVYDCAFAQPEGWSALARDGREGFGMAFAACVALALRIVELSRLAIGLADVYEEEDYGETPMQRLIEEGLAEALADRALLVVGDSIVAHHVGWRLHLSRAIEKMIIQEACPSASVLQDLDQCEASLRALPSVKEEDEDDVWLAFLSERTSRVALAPCAETRSLCACLVRGMRHAAELRALFESGCGSLSRSVSDEGRQQPERDAKDYRVLHRALALTEAVQTDGSGRLVMPRSLAALELGAESRRAVLEGGATAHYAALGRAQQSVSLYDVVDDAARCEGAPSVFLATRPAIEWCATVACPALLDLFRALCFNRARLHIMVRSQLIEQWGNIIGRAASVDMKIAKQLGLSTAQPSPHRYLTTLAIRIALYLMTLNLELNVELQLTVSPPELETLFFYRDFIATSTIRLVASARRYKEALQRDLNRRKFNSDDVKQADCIELELDATRSLCRGMHLLSVAIIKNDEARFRDMPFGSWHLRYEQRFEHFRLLPEPPYVPHDQFLQLTTEIRNAQQRQLLDAADEHFQRAKHTVDRVLKLFTDDTLNAFALSRSKIVGMAKVAVANRVTIAKIKRRLESTQPAPRPLRAQQKATYEHGDEHGVIVLHPRPEGSKRNYCWSNDLDLRFHPHFPVLTHEE